MRVVCEDYFQYTSEEKYNVILDYTSVWSHFAPVPLRLIDRIRFLCALPRTLRTNWSSQLTALSVPSPSTRLVTLMFPLGLDMDGPGPPYPLSEEVYHDLLDESWEMLSCEEIVTGNRRVVGGKGAEKMAVWMRKLIVPRC